jgi:chemosensory pili system protein ChpA (sensor histidine kinase/response regulator)
MLVEVAQNTYALPLLQVEETASVNQENLTLRDDGYFIQLRGMEIPVIHMSNLLKMKDAPSAPMSGSSMYPVIIVQDEGKKAGLLVDNIIQREEILIKNIGESLQRTKYIMGGTILADGRVVLVLDIPQIVFTSLRLKERSAALLPEDFRGAKDKPQQAEVSSSKGDLEKKVIKGRKPRILIVDDSLSVRKFLSGMLAKNNYEVETAKNGQGALEMLAQNDYDAIITDLEMPQLSGYELIEQIRADSRWDKLPIIVLTGRASKQIEQQSLKLGANQFVIKPFKDKDLLVKLSLYIDYQA